MNSGLFKNSKIERHRIHKEEYDLNISPLGEMEIFCDSISGVALSICNGSLPIRHIDVLKKLSLRDKRPNFQILLKYPITIEYIELFEKIRDLCIEVLEKN